MDEEFSKLTYFNELKLKKPTTADKYSKSSHSILSKT